MRAFRGTPVLLALLFAVACEAADPAVPTEAPHQITKEVMETTPPSTPRATTHVATTTPITTTTPALPTTTTTAATTSATTTATTTTTTKTIPTTTPTTTQATTAPRPLVPSIKINGSNCTKPNAISDVFNVSGLSGWELVSHDDYQGNSASKHSHNLSCSWVLPKPEPNLVLLIEIIKLQLEPSSSCEFDVLNLQYVDYNSSAITNMSVCGQVDNRFFWAKSQAKLLFRTDLSVHYRGFHLQWAVVNANTAARIGVSVQAPSSSVCVKAEALEVVTIMGTIAPGGRIVSHELDPFSFPYTESTYRGNMQCEWEIPLRSQYTLVWIEHLLLETGRRMGDRLCPYDNLTISYSNGISGRWESSVFCSLTREKLMIANSTVSIKFLSDASIESQGFFIKWLHLNNSVIPHQLLPSLLAEGNNSPVLCTSIEQLSNQTLSGVGSFSGGRLVSHTEFFNSINSSYHPNMNCTWTISPPDNATLIHLVILQVDLETGSDSYLECRYDNLTFSFVNSISNRYEERVTCNSMQSVKFTSSSKVTIRFVTDHSVAKRGFHLKWYFIPRQEAIRLSEWEDMQASSCPNKVPNSPGSRSGTLNLLNYRPNTHCVWRWTVDASERLVFEVFRLSLDPRDGVTMGSRQNMFCLRARDWLRIVAFDSDRNPMTRYFCGRSTLTRSIVAYQGNVEVSFMSDGSVQGLGFSLRYRSFRIEGPTVSPQLPQVACPAIERVNSHQSKLELTHVLATERCTWTVQPLDNSHAVRIAVKSFIELRRPYIYRPIVDRRPWTPYPYRPRFCSSQVTWVANRTVTESALFLAATMVAVNQTQRRDPFGITSSNRRTVCPSIGDLRHHSEFLSLGPMQIMYKTESYGSTVLLRLLIEHIPIVRQRARNLCPRPSVLNSKTKVIQQLPQSRLISVRQLQVTSRGDCCSSIVFDEKTALGDNRNAFSRYHYQRGSQLRFSVNCSRSGGVLFAVIGSDLTPIRCNSVALVNWTNQQFPAILEAEGTGGFTAVLEFVKYIYDGTVQCPTYNPTNHGTWIANLPLIRHGYHYLHMAVVGDMFYCEFPLSAPPGFELVVQLQVQTPVDFDTQQQFCTSLLEQQQQQQPQLMLIQSTPGIDDVTQSLCEQGRPGGLKLRNKIRVPTGAVLSVDLMASLVNSLDYGMSNRTRLTRADTYILVTVNQVQQCQSFEMLSWAVTHGRYSEIRTKIEVPFNNTQTDCRFQLDATNAVQIAGMISGGGAECWELEVTLSNLRTTCGLNQLMLIDSTWDPMSESVVHRQKEVCQTPGFSYTVKFMKADQNATGISLYYSGVRSGFTAEYAMRECRDTNLVGVPIMREFSNAGSVSESTPLVVTVLLLSLAIICTVIFALRAPILARGRTIVNRSRGSHRLSYTTGSEGVCLVDDSN